MTKIVGNDVSDYQGKIDWDTYKNNANFVLIKATEGINFAATTFKRNQSEARRVDLARGFYHFARPEYGNDPSKEADLFLAVIGELQEGEVLALDYEPATRIQSHVDWCKKWLDYVFSKTGVRALIYMSESVVNQLDWSSIAGAGYGLWIAKYLFNPTPDATYTTGKWSFAAMYQWTSTQKVPGIGSVADGDVFYGDVATFKKYGYKKPSTTPTPPTSAITDDTVIPQINNMKVRDIKIALDSSAGIASDLRKRAETAESIINKVREDIK